MTLAVLYRDTRLGEKDRWVYGDPCEARMNLPEDIKKALGYLITKRVVGGVEQVTYEGTGFFVMVPSIVRPDLGYSYLITAKHVIMTESGVVAPNLYLRLNTRAGAREDIEIKGKWAFHDNEDVDVALIALGPDSNYFDWLKVRYMPPTEDEGERDNMFADQSAIEGWGIGIGDELRVVGLFTKRTGNQQNIPIVRSGIIAAMPDEPIEATIKRYGKIVKVKFNAYLAEVRSIGGLSGSPVFVLIEHFRKPRKNAEMHVLLGVQHRIFLLGMIRGHWHYETQSSFITSAAANRPKDLEQVNMGMALVTPIADVLDVLYDEDGEPMKARAIHEAELEAQKDVEITEDSASAVSESELTREGFEGALRRASSRVSEPESKKTRTSE